MVSIVGIGGTTSEGSSTERALWIALRSARAAGADVRMFGGRELVALPHYGMTGSGDDQPAVDLLSAIRSADGVIIASSGYHGSISGLVKNAIDYLEDTARDERPYLSNLPVGLIVTAYGWQATGSTLGTLHAIVHALRGWPTPMGAGVKSASGLFTDEGCTDATVAAQLELVGRQVVAFAQAGQASRASTPAPGSARPIAVPADRNRAGHQRRGRAQPDRGPLRTILRMLAKAR